MFMLLNHIITLYIERDTDRPSPWGAAYCAWAHQLAVGIFDDEIEVCARILRAVHSQWVFCPFVVATVCQSNDSVDTIGTGSPVAYHYDISSCFGILISSLWLDFGFIG